MVLRNRVEPLKTLEQRAGGTYHDIPEAFIEGFLETSDKGREAPPVEPQHRPGAGHEPQATKQRELA
jgi:hypothetical protein